MIANTCSLQSKPYARQPRTRNGERATGSTLNTVVVVCATGSSTVSGVLDHCCYPLTFFCFEIHALSFACSAGEMMMLTACRRQTSTGDDYDGLAGLEELRKLSEGRLQAADAAPVAARARSAHDESTRLPGVLMFAAAAAAALVPESRLLAPVWRPV